MKALCTCYNMNWGRVSATCSNCGRKINGGVQGYEWVGSAFGVRYCAFKVRIWCVSMRYFCKPMPMSGLMFGFDSAFAKIGISLDPNI